MKSSTTIERTEQIPSSLLAIAALTDALDPAQLRGALAAARQALADLSESGEIHDCHDRIQGFIGNAAFNGHYKEYVEKASDLDPGNIEGGLQNAFSDPALLVGMSLAWLVLTGERTL